MDANLIAALGSAGGQTVYGEMAGGDVAELKKALEMGYGTDSSQLQGGGALRIQSLERTMLSTIQENEHFKLFNALQKSNATATVDEWTEQSSVGGFRGGSTNTETGAIASAQGQYARRVGMVKYLMTRREVSFVSTLGNNLASAEAVEASNGALQLLTDAEHLCFEGDSRVVGTEFDGIYAQLDQGIAAGTVSGDHVIDQQGAALYSIDAINKAAALVSGAGNFGTLTDMFLSYQAQADFDSKLDPAFRVNLDNNPNSLMLGAPVAGIRTSFGIIKNQPDVFVRDEPNQTPFEVQYPTVAVAQVALKPAAVAVDATGTAADSQWTASRAGNYYYLVCGVNASGESTGLLSAQVALAAGKVATLTITASAGGQESGYAIYRSRQNGSSASSDLRLVKRIARTGASTVYVDKNRDIPGTTKGYLLNMKPGQMAITWRQLLPMLKFALYPTVSATVPWAQMMFGYLRLGKLRQHAVVKNILPAGATWRPFTNE